MLKINSIRIERFKNIRSVTMSLDDINLLIGGNNAGKSSVIQAIHFAVATLRSARMHGKSAGRPATTLGIDQFNYLPTQELMRIHYGYGDRASADDLIGDRLPLEYCLGKILLPKIEQELRVRNIQFDSLIRESDGLFVQQLQEFEFPD